MDRLFRSKTLVKTELDPNREQFRQEVQKLFAVAFFEARARFRPRGRPARNSGKSKALTPRTRG